MTTSYLSKDRERINRMQRERRAGLVRIDFHPDADVLPMIEAKRPRYGPETTNSAVLNAIVREWATLTGIKWSEVDAPVTSTATPANAGIDRHDPRARVSPTDSGISAFFAPMRASKTGGKLGAQQRVPCHGKRRRDGKPCQALSVPGKRRCKWHGGHSTGPKTPEGKARALANLWRGKEPASGD